MIHGKAVWGLQRTLDFLTLYDYIDTNRIGIIGHSLGGWDSQFLSGLDTKVKAAVVNAAGNIKFRKDIGQTKKHLLRVSLKINKIPCSSLHI